MRKIVELVCVVCNNEFTRCASETKRNARLNRKIYCSLKCSGIDNVEHLFKYDNSKYLDNPGNRLDTLSCYRSPLRMAKMHATQKNREFNLTLDDLQKQWHKQSGICPYTGWELYLPPSSTYAIIGEKKIQNSASLDRIDSSIGYVPENIQFVSVMANLAKNNFSHETMIEFCKAIANNWK